MPVRRMLSRQGEVRLRKRGEGMSFGVYLFLATAALLLLRWVLFVVVEQTDDGPSFLGFMLEPKGHPDDRFRPLMLALFAAVAVIGYMVTD